MPARRFFVQIPASRLLIASLVFILPICIAGLLSLAHADKSLGKTVGNHFKTIADISGSEVSRFIHDRVTDVGVMAMEFDVVDAAAAANKSYTGKSDASIATEFENMEKIWNTPASESVANRVLASRASQLLRKHRDFDRRFLRITVTDAKGIPVAATHKTLDYYQGDEEFWQAVYASGRGAVNITDVLYDDVTKAHYIGIGVPILEDGTNRFIGMVDALVDVSAIFAIVNRMQFGSTARIMLVKDDGTVIAAPGVNLSMKLTSDEYAAIRESGATVTGNPPGFLVADLKAGRNVIGFADTGLKGDYGNLGWVVLAAQETSEAFGPMKLVYRIIAFMSIVGLLAVTLFGVYVSLHRRERFEHFGGEANLSREQSRTASM
jgi:hypothetical protein